MHQIADTIRHVGTSDRNFYDRYYFNLHGSSDELFMVMGLGQYPNLAVQDAFACVRRGGLQHVVRASRELGDRMDTSVGPFRVEVIEPCQGAFVCDPSAYTRSDADSGDLRSPATSTWEGAIPAFEEPRQYVRKYGRVLFDTMRFAQTGCWTGTLEVAGETFDVTPDRWWGTRDRSWGVRPHGEPEHPGIRQGEGQMSGMWNYSPMQFDDHSILYMLNETGERRARPRGGDAHLGRPRTRARVARPPRVRAHHAQRHADDRAVSVLAFPDAPDGALRDRRDAAARPRSSRSARATASRPTGATACTRGRSSCRAAISRSRRSRASASSAIVDHVARFE